jgi:hypothetical protein
MTTSAQDLSGVPITWEQAEIEFARDQYLSTTAVGNYVIALWYANEEKLVKRAKEIKTEPPDHAFAQALYMNYLGEAKLALASLGVGGGLPLTEQHYADAQAAVLSAKKYLTTEEGAVLEKALELLRQKAPPGTTPSEALRALDDGALLDQAKKLAASIGYLDSDVEKWVKPEDPAPAKSRRDTPEQQGTP